MIIYGSTMSPFVRKVVAFALEKRAEFELKPVQFQDEDPDFRAASPLGKMPAIHDDGFNLADSSAICHYLDRKHPEPQLIPDEAKARGTAVWWDEYSDTVLVPCGARMFFNRVVSPVFLKQEGNDAVADRAETDELPVIMQFLEQRVPEAGDYLVGGTLTLADLSLASPFVNLDHSNAAVDWSRYPRLDGWTRTILSRPSLAGSVQREQAFFRKVDHGVSGRIGA